MISLRAILPVANKQQKSSFLLTGLFPSSPEITKDKTELIGLTETDYINLTMMDEYSI